MFSSPSLLSLPVCPLLYALSPVHSIPLFLVSSFFSLAHPRLPSLCSLPPFSSHSSLASSHMFLFFSPIHVILSLRNVLSLALCFSLLSSLFLPLPHLPSPPLRHFLSLSFSSHSLYALSLMLFSLIHVILLFRNVLLSLALSLFSSSLFLLLPPSPSPPLRHVTAPPSRNPTSPTPYSSLTLTYTLSPSLPPYVPPLH